MPLYLIETKGSDAKRLIDATSETAAIKHAATGVFTARRISKPTEVASLVTGGAKVETAGEVVPDPLPDSAAIVTAAGAVIADAAEPMPDDAIFANLITREVLPDTPEARTAFDVALAEGREAGTMSAAVQPSAEPGKGGKTK